MLSNKRTYIVIPHVRESEKNILHIKYMAYMVNVYDKPSIVAVIKLICLGAAYNICFMNINYNLLASFTLASCIYYYYRQPPWNAPLLHQEASARGKYKVHFIHHCYRKGVQPRTLINIFIIRFTIINIGSNLLMEPWMSAQFTFFPEQYE